MKICSICNISKEINLFGADRYRSDGLNNRCKDCLKLKYRTKIYPRVENGSKICMHCKIEKEYSKFGNNKANSDGMHVWCKECACLKSRQYRKKYSENYEREKQKNFINWREKLGVPPHIKLRNKKGEGYINRQGYLSFKIKDHPCADKNGRVQASHLVVFENTGRVIKKGESVHHKNGLRLDNSFENLEIWTTSQPAGQRVDDKIKWCIEFLKGYGYKIKSPKNNTLYYLDVML